MSYRNKTQKQKKYPKRIYLYSNPRKAQHMAYKYLGKTAKLYPVNFGQMGYEDYTKHHDKKRRKNYLTRSKSIKGDWKKNKYSANNLSRNVIW